MESSAGASRARRFAPLRADGHDADFMTRVDEDPRREAGARRRGRRSRGSRRLLTSRPDGTSHAGVTSRAGARPAAGAGTVGSASAAANPMYRVAALLVSASGIRYAGQLVLLVLIARAAGATGVGTYTVALAVCAPVFIIAGFGIRTVRLTLRRDVPTRSYERFLLTSLVCACALVTLIGLFLPAKIGIVVLLIAILRIGETFMELYGAMLQRGGRPGAIVVVIGTGTSLQVASVAFVFAVGGGLVAALAASAAAYLLVLVLATRPLALAATTEDGTSARRASAGGAAPRARTGAATGSTTAAGTAGAATGATGDWRVLFAAGLPTGIAIGMITLLSTVPQYLLGWVGGVADAGRFAVLLYVVVAVEVLLHALAQSWIPQARRLLDRTQLTPAAVARTALRWTFLTGVPGLTGLAAAAFLLPRVLGPEFAITPALAVPLAVTVLLVPASFAADTAVVVRNRYALSLTVSVTALVIGTAVGAVLVALGLFDLPAALWTFAVTMAVRAAAGFAAVTLSSDPRWADRGGRRRRSSRGSGRNPRGTGQTPRGRDRSPWGRGWRRWGRGPGRPRGRLPSPGERASPGTVSRSWMPWWSRRPVFPGGTRLAVSRYWPVLPIGVAAVALVAAGPRWVFATTAAVLLILLLTVLRVGVPQLLVMTVPLAFYVTAGGMLVNLAVSDVLLLLLLVRVLVDPDCVRAAAHVSGPVRAALCVLALLLALTAGTILVRSSLGAPAEWTAFAADAVKLVVVIGYFVICAAVFRDLLLRRDYRFLTVWAFTAAVVGALGTVGAILFAQGRPTDLTMDFRATGTFEDPNAFATYLIMSIPLVLLARHVTGKSLLSWHQVPILAGIVASFSRGALVGLAAVLVVLCVFAFRDPALRALRIVAILAVGAAALFILDGAVSSAFEGSRGVSFDEDVRFRLWAAAIDVWLHAPIVGVGLGQFVVSSEDLLGSAGGVLAHNTYLSVLAEGGIVGSALYAALPALAVVGLLRRGDTIARLLLSSGVGIAVMAVSLNLQNFRPIWLFIALAVAWTVTPRDDEPPSAPPSAQRLSAHPPATHPRRAGPLRAGSTTTHPLVHPTATPSRTERSWN
ncbi:O-antigen ligase family protein [Brevibacterium yomogidense]|uniref:O-antigen ligase family protein n=1 Tax=Brevibacterium yomogidense TaxID=946573 RepID=UPI0018DFB3D8|nr:O-antigen ligase family protein [Brevibacterium yomogidense]